MINFLDPKEAPTFPIVLGRMSEDKKCLLTGVTNNLTYFPVDTNPNNFLPSNMACISDDIAKEIFYTYYYDIEFYDYVITFDTPSIFQEYNEKALQLILSQRMHSGDKEKFSPPNHCHLTSLYEYLTKYHVKGILRIATNDKKTWMDNGQYQGYLLRKLAEEKTKTESKIITPNLGIVKP